MSKITTGNNDRPKDATIAQTGEGLPDDSSTPVEITDEEVERARQSLTGENPRENLKKEVKDEIELPLKGSA